MGQLLSKPPTSVNTRKGGKREHIKQKPEKHDGASKSIVSSRAKSRLWGQHRGNHKAPTKLSNKAETKSRTRRRHSTSHPKDPSRKGSKGHDVSGTPKHSHRKRASDLVDRTRRHQDHQAKARPRTNLKSRLTIHSSSSSLSHSVSQFSQREAKDCIICAEARSPRRFPNRTPTVQCDHAVDACRKCLRTWIKSEFETRIWDEMTCPICSLRMNHEDMREFAPRDVFRRYDKLSTRAALEKIPGFTWCIANGCKSGHIHNAATNKFTCMACNKSHCTQHNVPWHKRETCKEYDYRTNKMLKKEEEAASKKLIEQTTKKCPGCKRNIEKNQGCDHMTCSKCKHQFCWICLAPYVKYKVVHTVECNWYTAPRT